MAWWHEAIASLEHKNRCLEAEVRRLKQKLQSITDVVEEKKPTPHLTDSTLRCMRMIKAGTYF